VHDTHNETKGQLESEELYQKNYQASPKVHLMINFTWFKYGIAPVASCEEDSSLIPGMVQLPSIEFQSKDSKCS